MKEITVVAVIENLDTVQAGLAEAFEAAGCDAKTQFQLEVAVEEIFVNICSYAYPPGSGMAWIRAELQEDPRAIRLTFEDSGTPFDPLAREKANPEALLADEEKQGGLGLLMVRETMDELKYEYREGHNVLTMLKKL